MSRSKLVIRPRLLERLTDGLNGKLILISAPVGFGKTTLVTDWLSTVEIPSTWLSLDEEDNDLSRFITYVVAAIQLIAPQIGDVIRPLLQSTQPPPPESILTLLLNELATLPHPFILVLDDYHLIDSKAVNDTLIFLLEHLPQQMHLVITTREDPNLPLARLRARHQLTEVRAVDLRFTNAEASTFLLEVMRLKLPPEAVTTLEARTEGWIAGLQLAALSLQGHSDSAEFIRLFAGDHRYIVDYLVEEVLVRQPESVRNFLLQTSILDRMNEKLCEAVTGQSESSEQLEELERGNFFLIPLDHQRHWYRYHHLFADVLQVHLQAEQPARIPKLHERASIWYEQNGWTADAIRHAISAKNFERAADLVETFAPDMRRNRQETTLRGWLKALPDHIFHLRPMLNLEFAGVLLSCGEIDGVEHRLQTVENLLEPNTNSDAQTEKLIVVDPHSWNRLPAWVALYRAGLSLALGNISDSVIYARQALDRISEDDHILIGSATAIIGLASWSIGDLEPAYQSFADGMTHLEIAGNISDAVGGSLALADIRISQGRLRDAMRVYERGLNLAADHDEPQMRGTADMYVGMCNIYREFNNLDVAKQYMQRSREQGEHTGFPQHPYRWRVAMAKIQQAEGYFDDALDLLHEAENVYIADFFPNIHPIRALKARVWLQQGNLREALDWVSDQRLTVDDDLDYLREFEHITLTRILLAHYKIEHHNPSLQQAIHLLERLLNVAQQGQRTGSLIEISILQALAYQMKADDHKALTAMECALRLAEREGYIRMFIDEGSAMMQLLERALQQKISPHYARKLLDSYGKQANKSTGGSNLIDPLSDREMEVLRLFGTELSGPEIADELMISLNTLRTHTKNIYTKLAVNSRRSAIRRAEELNLL